MITSKYFSKASIMKILIIDYGMGNLGSVKSAFERCGYDVIISKEPKDADKANALILPGVGSFDVAMNNLSEKGWDEILKIYALDRGIPLWGICLGMQLLADIGYENSKCSGLGLIAGKVKKLIPSNNQEHIPHIGWNEILFEKHCAIFDDIKSGTDFYFVHSYHFIPATNDNILSITPYCGHFVSSICQNNILGTQFHPEKSTTPGMKLIKNFIKYSS